MNMNHLQDIEIERRLRIAVYNLCMSDNRSTKRAQVWTPLVGQQKRKTMGKSKQYDEGNIFWNNDVKANIIDYSMCY